MTKNSNKPLRLVVQGAAEIADVPGLEAHLPHFDIACAPDSSALAKFLPEAEILLGWNFRGTQLADNWQHAKKLKWIHWCGAGVDAVLFPELRSSNVILTNSRGLFDLPMAEYTLGYMLSEIKLLPETRNLQAQKRWQHRFTSRLAGQSAAIYGVGSIGREIARLLNSVGVKVCGVGRSARSGDADFGEIYSSAEKLAPLADADWVIGILPSTPETADYFDNPFFAAMKPTARFINLGRGTAVIEPDLVNALEVGTIAGAMLDVFRTEPLPADSPLWTTPNLFVSPHLSGDYAEYPVEIAQMFFDNLEAYAAGRDLANVVDKQLGFVRT